MSKEIRQSLQKDRLELIFSQHDITDEEYKVLAKKWLPTSQDTAAITAYRVRHRLCADLNEGSVRFFLDGGLKKLELFEILFAPTSGLEDFDRQQAQVLEPILRECAAQKQRVLQRVLGILGVNGDFHGEFTHRQCQEVVDYILGDAAQMNLLFHGIISVKSPPRCATRFVIRFLARLGLRLETRKSMGRMIRFINQEDVEQMRKYAQRRLDKRRSFVDGLLAGTPP